MLNMTTIIMFGLVGALAFHCYLNEGENGKKAACVLIIAGIIAGGFEVWKAGYTPPPTQAQRTAAAIVLKLDEINSQTASKMDAISGALANHTAGKGE